MIRLEQVSKRYGARVVLEQVTFTFPDKGLVCILGPSGSGKSTLLNLIAGFDSAYQGRVLVGGNDLRQMDADALCGYRREHVGFVFQNYHLLRGYTALENVLLATGTRREDQGEREMAACQLLQRLGLSGKEDQRAETLSGGQRQRVAIARALVNDPALILADEPTGALDRSNAREIMALLRQLAQDRLVVVITHDPKCAAYGDQILTIEGGKLVSDRGEAPRQEGRPLGPAKGGEGSVFHLAVKNFRVRLRRYLAISAAIALGVLCFALSLSSGNVMQGEIARFEEKNTAFRNGSIQANGEEARILDVLREDDRLEHVYPQYVLHDVSLEARGLQVTMEEKYPMAKAAETLAYGVMPRRGEGEIALSPSLAAKFSKDIQNLVGATVRIRCGDHTDKLTISGIFNAAYDDFYLSSDVEQELYTGMSGKAYAVSYDVMDFEDIVPVSQSLQQQGLEPRDAAAQAQAFLTTFHNLQRLFFAISLLMLGVCLLISAVLLVKQQNTRMREMGLMSALGYQRRTVRRMLWQEGGFLCACTAAFGAVLSDLALFLASLWGLSLRLSIRHVLGALALSAVVTLGLYVAASLPLTRTQPAQALRSSG